MNTLDTASQIEEWIVRYLCRRLDLEEHDIDLNGTFSDHGLSSVEGIALVRTLEQKTELTLSPTLVWEHPTIKFFAQHVAAVQNEGVPTDEGCAPTGVGCRTTDGSPSVS